MKKAMLLSVITIGLTGCASLFNEDYNRPKPTSHTSDTSDATPGEAYVDCIRDKKRDPQDPPCRLD